MGTIMAVVIIPLTRDIWGVWTGFKQTTSLELLGLILVPISIFILGSILQQQQRKRVEEEAKEEILQGYFDRLSYLLVDKNILAIAVKLYASETKKENGQCQEKVTLAEKELLDAAVDVIRARTLSILRRFKDDGERKGSVIRFLAETEIFNKVKLNLSDANLSDADLSATILREVNFRDVNLNNANLCLAKFDSANLNFASIVDANLTLADLSCASLDGAKFCRSDLSCASLMSASVCHADLSRVNLRNATLRYADLSNANLSNADLSKADLRDSELTAAALNSSNFNGCRFNNARLIGADFRNSNITQEQLINAKLCLTILPDGIDLNPDRDCQELRIDPETREYFDPKTGLDILP